MHGSFDPSTGRRRGAHEHHRRPSLNRWKTPQPTRQTTDRSFEECLAEFDRQLTEISDRIAAIPRLATASRTQPRQAVQEVPVEPGPSAASPEQAPSVASPESEPPLASPVRQEPTVTPIPDPPDVLVERVFEVEAHPITEVSELRELQGAIEALPATTATQLRRLGEERGLIEVSARDIDQLEREIRSIAGSAVVARLENGGIEIRRENDRRKRGRGH